MSKRQKRFAFLGAWMGLLYLTRDFLPEFLGCFLMGMASGLLVLNILLTEESTAKLCAWKKRVLARLVGRG